MMNELLVMTVFFIAFYAVYRGGYAFGRLAQIDKLVGAMTKHDARRLTIAVEKLCELAESLSDEKILPREKTVHH